MNPGSVKSKFLSGPLERWRTWMLPGFVVLCWLLTIRHLSSEWTFNEQYQFGWIVPLLSLYLFRTRMESAPAPSPPLSPAYVWWIIPAITAVELLLLPLHEANADWRLLGWSFAGLASIATLVAFGRAGGWAFVRHFAFPTLFFFIAVPWQRQFETDVTQWLMQHNALLAAEVLRWIGVDAAVQGNLIRLTSTTMGIDEACSGIRSLQGTLMSALFVGEIFDLNRRRRILLVLIGAALTFLMNAARMVFLSVVTQQGGMDAHERWHDPAGHWSLGVCVVGVTFAGWLWGRTKPRQKPAQSDPTPPASAPARSTRHAAEAGAALFGTIVVIAGLGATELWFRIHEAHATRLVAWRFAQPVDAKNFEPISQSLRVRGALRFSQHSGGRWQEADGKRWVAHYFRWDPGLNDVLASLNHDPRVCLEASGKKLVSSLAPVHFKTAGITLPFDAFWFRDQYGDVFVFNCVIEDVRREEGEEQVDSSYSLHSRFEAACRGHRNLGRRRLEVAVWGTSDPEVARDSFQRLLEKQIVTQDGTSLGVTAVRSAVARAQLYSSLLRFNAPEPAGVPRSEGHLY